MEEGIVDMAELMGDVVTGPGSFDPPSFDFVPTGEEKDEDGPFGKVGSPAGSAEDRERRTVRWCRDPVLG